MKPPSGAIEAAKSKLSDDVRAEEIRGRVVEMLKEEKLA